MTTRIEELTPDELQAAMTRRPLIYMPCGLIEWHGRHLPLGLDGLKIHGIVLGCAERTGGVVLPVNWIGVPGFGSFCGTLNYPPELVKAVLQATLAECAKLGARVIALVTGHYGNCQVDTVKAAAAEFMAAHPGVLVLARAEYEGARVGEEVPADHAGKWESSMALNLFPHLVHMDRHAPGVEPIHQYDPEHALWDAERRPWTWSTDLRQTSSAALGEQAVRAIRESIIAEVETLCQRAGI